MLKKSRVDNRIYVAIDLKSFYASVECKDRGLDPLKTNLLVADVSRTNKTICLAVSPSLKSFGMGGRVRLFEAVDCVNEVNRKRNPKLFDELRLGEFKETVHQDCIGRVIGDEIISSVNFDILNNKPNMLVDFIVAPPRMATYMKYSAAIYKIYLKYVDAEDIHVYSIDEVFIDITNYLNIYKMTARELVITMIHDILDKTGITATAGIGTNLYLAKIAMDIVAKKIPADKDGVRIAELDEINYRKKLWNHKPLSDFWRIGRGHIKKLNNIGIYTMGDIAKCSLGKDSDYYNEDLLFKLFGINAELLIDHAWGYEPITIKEIKSYRPNNSSISTGQVLTRPYDYNEARIVIFEMIGLLSIDLVKKHILTDSIVLTVGYDIENLDNSEKLKFYKGEITTDWYGRIVPKHAHGTISMDAYTNSTKILTDKCLQLYDKIIDRKLSIRRITIEANHIKIEKIQAVSSNEFKQISLFDVSSASTPKLLENKDKNLEQEKAIQKAMIAIRKRYGNNAILKASSLKEGATAMERNKQIGGHRA